MIRHRAVALLILTACIASAGGSSAAGADEAAKSPSQILADASQAMSTLRTVHVRGVSIDRDGRSTYSADVSTYGASRLTLRQGAEQANVRTLSAGIFYNANTAFWHKEGGLSTAAAAKLVNRWVKLPNAKGTQSLSSALSPKTLAHCVTHGIGTLSKAFVTLDGKPVIVLTSVADKPGAAPGRVYVAASGPPLVLRAVQTGPSRAGGRYDPRCDDRSSPPTQFEDDRLSAFDKPLNVSEPSSFLDLSVVGGSGTHSKTI